MEQGAWTEQEQGAWTEQSAWTEQGAWMEQGEGQKGARGSVSTVDPCRHSRQSPFLQKLNA